MSELSHKQQMFCREYLIDLNATQAAIRAGYHRNSARQQGARLLTNAAIRKLLSELTQTKMDGLAIDAKTLLSDMLAVLSIAKQEVITKRGAQQINAFKGIADSVGKHVAVQAFKENLKLTGETITTITCTLVRPKVDNRPRK